MLRQPTSRELRNVYSSLSKQIKGLEDEIGFPIFVRNRDGVRITPAGQMIIAYAQKALSARREIPMPIVDGSDSKHARNSKRRQEAKRGRTCAHV